VDLTEINSEGMDWNDMACDKDNWQAVVNTVMKLAGCSEHGNEIGKLF
jgi:hypothetical protein